LSFYQDSNHIVFQNIHQLQEKAEEEAEEEEAEEEEADIQNNLYQLG
jgi:CO dehydrogenase/acetyl-CoA synthase beta subunit